MEIASRSSMEPPRVWFHSVGVIPSLSKLITTLLSLYSFLPRARVAAIRLSATPAEIVSGVSTIRTQLQVPLLGSQAHRFLMAPLASTVQHVTSTAARSLSA